MEHHLILAPSSSRAAGTYNLGPNDSRECSGIRLCVDATVVAGTIDAKLQRKQHGAPVDTWVDIAGASVTAVAAPGTTDLLLYPGITPVANRAVASHLGGTWRVVATSSGTSTFSIGAVLLA